MALLLPSSSAAVLRPYHRPSSSASSRSSCRFLSSKPQHPLRCLRLLAASSSLSPIFLPHLQSPRSPNPDAACFDDDEDELDPLINFFHRGSDDIAESSADGDAYDEDEGLGFEEPDSLDSSPSGDASDAVVEEVLRLARSLPANATLGDALLGFVGRLGEADCIKMLKRMRNEGLGFGVTYFFEWMLLQEPPLVTPRACSIAFPAIGRAGMGDRVVALLQNLPPGKGFKDVIVYNAAISGCASSRRYDEVWRIVELMETNNVRPDHVTCSILLTVMRRTGKTAKQTWQFFEQMHRHGVQWSVQVGGNLIKSFCDEGLTKEALIIQSEMERQGILSNTIIYNTFMSTLAKSGRIEEVEGVLKEMKEKGLQPNAATYNIVMDAYGRQRQPEILEDILVEMQRAGMKPDVLSYTCLISAYGYQKNMSEKAADVFLRMRKAGIKPSSHSYTALIHAYSVDGLHEKAYLAFKDMKRRGVEPSVETYTTLLNAFRRAGNTDKLMEVWKSMIQEKVEGTRVTFNIVLDGLAKHGLYVQARDVIHEYSKLGMQPTVMTYNILMNAYARGGQERKMPQLLKEMAALQLKPDHITYTTMIYAYIRVRDFARAFYYHRQMVRSKQVPDYSSYQKLRSILDVKAATKNSRDRSAILGIVNSKFGVKARRGKKDEFWKNRKWQKIDPGISKNGSQNDKFLTNDDVQ